MRRAVLGPRLTLLAAALRALPAPGSGPGGGYSADALAGARAGALTGVSARREKQQQQQQRQGKYRRCRRREVFGWGNAFIYGADADCTPARRGAPGAAPARGPASAICATSVSRAGLRGSFL